MVAAPVPPTLDGAVPIAVADTSKSSATGATRHTVGGEEQPDFEKLVIAQYPGASDYYLFYCRDDWSVVTDTWHRSIEAAKAQAAFEYDGIEFTVV